MLYTVQRGDSPARIAQKITGNPARMPQLLEANPGLPRTKGYGITLRSLAVGQELQLPRAWDRGFALGDANSVAIELQTIQAQASNGPVADADGSYHGSVTAYQIAGAAAVSGLGPDIDSTYGIGTTGPAGTQAAWSTNSSLASVHNGSASDANPATLADAQTAQGYLSAMSGYYQSAVTAGDAVGGAGNTPAQPIANQNASATALNAYLLASGCDCSAQLQALTKTFQLAAGIKADGYYGTQSQKALATALGSSAPSPCYTPSGPCYPGGKPVPAPVVPSGQGCAAGTVADLQTGACVAPCSNGSAPSGGVCGVTPPAASAVTASNGPLIAGVLLVLLGTGAVTYAVKKRHHAGHA